MSEIIFVTVDPGHFHAGLLHKEMYPGVNARAANPTTWQIESHASPDFFERLLRERPGNVAIFSGRNRGKIDRIKACLDAGIAVLADTPWIIRAEDLPSLEAALASSERNRVPAYDIMTERYEITSLVQRALVNTPSVFGEAVAGSEAEPGVYMESVHHLFKFVAGVPLLRPAWFFDVAQQGEALADVGTHLVDGVQWTLFPDQAIDYRRDLRIISACRWPDVIDQQQFQRMTNEPKFPEYLAPYMRNGRLEYFCNTRVNYTIRGIYTAMDVVWRYQAPEGTGDTLYAVFRGTKARIEVRQRKEESFRPEVYVVPAGAQKSALDQRVAELQSTWPGIAVEDLGKEWRVTIPDRYRVGHEAHFGQVASQYLPFVRGEDRMPAWENPNMMAKYWGSTKGVEASH